jgi:uncharacterized protein YtpQ (UPF0354 family)
MKYLPQFFPSHWTLENEVFGIPFTDEISIGFVLRENNCYSYLLKEEFKLLKIKANILLDRSLLNLVQEFDNCEIKLYQIKGGTLVFWYSETDNFTAVRLLSHLYLQKLQHIFNGEFYFSIPDRDRITCWQTQDTEKNEQFINETIEDFNGSEYRLSKKIYSSSALFRK